MTPPVCPYCQKPTVLVGGSVIYPHRTDLDHKQFWLCRPCDAYVGCHKGTDKPLGTPANAVVRHARMKAHDAFDLLWQSGRMKRSEAYVWIRRKLGVFKDVHIGQSDVNTCLSIIAFVKDELGALVP